MGIEVVHVFGIESCGAESQLHAALRTSTPWGREMECVAGTPVPHHLRIDPSSSCFRVLQLLQNHDSSPLAQHKAVAIHIKGAARLSGRFIVT